MGLRLLSSASAQARLAQYQPWPAQLDIGMGHSTRHQPCPGRLDIGSDDSARHGLGPTLLNLGLNCLGSTWIGPSQNLTQNAIWIIQKCIQSIFNSYPIKWIGFKIQKYGLDLKSKNMNLDLK